MIIVLGTAKLGAGGIEEAKPAMEAMVTASNAEEGCISYDYALDILDPNILHVAEKWVDEAALTAHFQTPHMAEFRAAIASLNFEVKEVLRYETEGGKPLI